MQQGSFRKTAVQGMYNQDTIWVSDTETTYLLFPNEVQLIDIGRTGDYFAKIEGKSVFLKARSNASGPTNFLVRYGSEYYTARIQFAALPARSLYDMRVYPATQVEEEKVAHDVAGAKLARLREEADQGGLQQRSRHGLTLRLTQLQIDRLGIYLAMHLSNPSSIDYQLDFVGFSFQEKKGRRFSRNNSFSKEVRPNAQAAPELIPAHGEAELLYALPLFAMSSRGRLLIQFREKEGSRILRMSIPARRINRATLFSKGHAE